MRTQLHLGVILLSLSFGANAFPAYASLAGLRHEEIEVFMRNAGPLPGASPAPGPATDTSAKLVNDASHPYRKPGPHDIRGPCPGLNTLASHGYLNRSGIATPQEIVTAVQDGFNMKNDLAVLVTWSSFLVDGNQLTNLMSIGEKSPLTGQDPPSPAIVGGLNTHGVFEGDASSTRGDFAFGDNHSFNETLFEQFVSTSNQLGNGMYNATVATQVRFQRLQDSMARNPVFDFTTPRFFTAYAEAVFPYRFFVDGRSKTAALDMDAARGFFQDSHFPDDFHRREGAFGLLEIGPDVGELQTAHPVPPGRNDGAGNYVTDPSDPVLLKGICGFYEKYAGTLVPSLYPNPTAELQAALKTNLATFYSVAEGFNCTQLFPYGK